MDIASLPYGTRAETTRFQRRRCLLPNVLIEEFDELFGADLSDVLVFEGPEAGLLFARAFAFGTEIYFDYGAYKPWTRAGVELLAHELTHVLQQRQGRVCAASHQAIAVVDDPDLEEEAREMGRRAASCLYPLPAFPAGGYQNAEVDLGRPFRRAAGTIQCAPGDRVRIAESQEFAIVCEDTSVSISSITVLKNDLKVFITKEEKAKIAAEALLPSHQFYIDRQVTNAVEYVEIVANRQIVPPPLPKARRQKVIFSEQNKTAFRSIYEYDVRKKDGSVIAVNGAFLIKNPPRTIREAASESDFFEAVNRRIPLVYIPAQMRSKDFELAFRGDTRAPNIVFERGFETREDHKTPAFRTVSDSKPHFDILSPTGVCVSGHPDGGCIFPLIEEGSTVFEDVIYLYCFFAYQAFETCQIQTKLAETAEGQTKAFIENLLKAHEIVLGRDGVPPESIICCFKVSRKWHSDNWLEGAELTLGEFTTNKNSHYCDDPSYRDLLNMLYEKVKGSCKHTPVFT
jgi:hypothetical protein